MTEQVIEPVLDTNPAPEAEAAPTPEVQETNHPTEEKVEATNDNAVEQEVTPEPTKGETEINLYQETLSKYNKDPNYQMTDEEAEAFLSVQERISNGEIKDPGEKVIEEKKEQPEESEQPKEEKSEVEKPDEAETEKEINGLSDKHSDLIYESLKKVGAKDINELPEKIDGLIKQMTSSGGKMGNELKELRTREAANAQLFADLKEGKQEAWDYINKVTGRNSQPQKPVENTSKKDESFDDDYLDDKLAGEVNELKQLVKSQSETINKLQKNEETRVKNHERSEAANAWVDDVVDMVAKNPDDFGLSASEARALAVDYWSPKGVENPIHPKFQKIHDIIVLANERGLSYLEDAHTVWSQKNGHFAKKLAEATKKGQKSTNYKPAANNFISQQQGRQKNNVPDPHIDEERVDQMARGQAVIPDEWMDEDGNLIPSKVPERFHQKAFGRMGKPK